MSNLSDLRRAAESCSNRTGLAFVVEEETLTFIDGTAPEPDSRFRVTVGEDGAIGWHQRSLMSADKARVWMEGIEAGMLAAVQLLPIFVKHPDGSRVFPPGT